MSIIRATEVMPSDHNTILRPDNFALGFTQSELGTWDDCPEKWYLGYNHMLRRRGTWAMYFVYGDAFHDTLSRWYATGEETVARLQLPPDVILTQEEEYEIEKWQRILEVQMERYFIYYQDDLRAWTPFLNEEIVELDFEGTKLTGKIDLGHVVDGQAENIITDHKSYGRRDPTTLRGWMFRFQFMFYLWIAQKISGRKIHKFVVNGMKKPALKQGKTESLDSFIVRIKQDMIQRPDEYFQRVPLATIQGSMEHFEERVLRPKLDRIHLLTQANIPDSIMESLVRNQNTNNCTKYGQVCQFLPICQNGFKREGFQYIQRESKHEELETE